MFSNHFIFSRQHCCMEPVCHPTVRILTALSVLAGPLSGPPCVCQRTTIALVAYALDGVVVPLTALWSKKNKCDMCTRHSFHISFYIVQIGQMGLRHQIQPLVKKEYSNSGVLKENFRNSKKKLGLFLFFSLRIF